MGADGKLQPITQQQKKCNQVLLASINAYHATNLRFIAFDHAAIKASNAIEGSWNSDGTSCLLSSSSPSYAKHQMKQKRALFLSI